MRFLIPEGGVSLIDAPGEPFWDPAADRALFDTSTRGSAPGPNRRCIRLPLQRQRSGLRRRAGRGSFGEIAATGALSQ